MNEIHVRTFHFKQNQICSLLKIHSFFISNKKKSCSLLKIHSFSMSQSLPQETHVSFFLFLLMQRNVHIPLMISHKHLIIFPKNIACAKYTVPCNSNERSKVTSPDKTLEILHRMNKNYDYDCQSKEQFLLLTS